MHPTQAEIGRLFMYSESDGILTWRSPRFSSRALMPAGSVKRDGYRYITIKRKLYAAHRLIWILLNGSEPDGLIDHINRIKTDNRIENLRIATKEQNAANAGMYSTNTSGFKGVYFCKRDKRFIASITFHGKIKRIGGFATAEEANEAYQRASLTLNKEFSPFN